jgi:DNA-binding response OmpR family regulator
MPAAVAAGLDRIAAVAQLLVVEDDDTIGRLLTESLHAHGHQVMWCRSGRAALRESVMKEFDLVLLDLGLPDLDGVEVCRQLRTAQPGCVLVILTARDAEIDVVVGLDAGADDYLTKPFRSVELLARIRAHLRRGPVPAVPVEAHVVGDLVVDPAARTCTFHGHPIELRAREFDLLARLAADAGVAVSRGTLMDDVWDENWYGSTKTLDVHIGILRTKLAAAVAQHGVDASSVPQIITLRGHGYRLDSRGLRP